MIMKVKIKLKLKKKRKMENKMGKPAKPMLGKTRKKNCSKKIVSTVIGKVPEKKMETIPTRF